MLLSLNKQLNKIQWECYKTKQFHFDVNEFQYIRGSIESIFFYSGIGSFIGFLPTRAMPYCVFGCIVSYSVERFLDRSNYDKKPRITHKEAGAEYNCLQAKAKLLQIENPLENVEELKHKIKEILDEKKEIEIKAPPVFEFYFKDRVMNRIEKDRHKFEPME